MTALLSCDSSQGGPAEKPTVLDAPRAAFRLRGVTGVQRVSQLTGAASPNATDRFGVEGTDLGSMFTAHGKTWFVFGDTFGKRPPGSIGATGENWRSNVLAYTSDTDPTDGITFDGMISDAKGRAKELLPSKKIDGVEMTVIPTHGFEANGAMYLHWMSVRHWGKPGEWETNDAGLARSTDEGKSWTVLEGPRWSGESHFVQVSPVKLRAEGVDWIYFWGTTHGRFGGLKLMRVPEARVESAQAYQYFTGTGADGAPQWGSRPEQARLVVDDTMGELSVVWNEYVGRWLMTYLKEGTGIVMREGLAPWGPWGEPHTMLAARELPGLYSPFMAQHYVRDGGKTLYFSLSVWGPYNVSWYKAELQREGNEGEPLVRAPAPVDGPPETGEAKRAVEREADSAPGATPAAATST